MGTVYRFNPSSNSGIEKPTNSSDGAKVGLDNQKFRAMLIGEWFAYWCNNCRNCEAKNQMCSNPSLYKRDGTYCCRRYRQQ